MTPLRATVAMNASDAKQSEPLHRYTPQDDRDNNNAPHAALHGVRDGRRTAATTPRPLPLRTPLSARDVKDLVKVKIAKLLLFLVKHGVRQQATGVCKRDTPAMVIAMFSRFETAKTLLSRGVNINGGYAHRRTSALYVACGFARLEVVQWLVENGAKVDDSDDQGVTPLMVAAARGRLRIVEYLVSVGADVSKVTTWQTSVAYQCAFNGNLAVLKFLVRTGSGKYKYDGSKENLLEAAFRGDQLEMVWYLLEHVDHDRDHVTACLVRAIQLKEIELVEMLICKGADVNSVDENACTPMFYAIEFGSIEILEVLLRYGADVRLGAARKWHSALHVMVGFGRFAMLELVENLFGKDLDCSAALSIPSDPPLYRAVSHGYADVLVFLLKVLPDLDINAPDTHRKRETPLMIAAGNGDVKVARILVAHGANINAKVYGSTALIKAALKGSVEVVEYLCEHGADVNLVTSNREYPTALFAAVRNGHVDVVEYLLEECEANMGADGSSRSTSMLRIGALSGHLEVVRLLLSHGASAHLDKGSNLLCKVILRGHLDVVRLLVKRGADVNAACGLKAKSAWGDGVQTFMMTPLVVAASCGNLEIVKYLCESGADVEGVTDTNESALFLAALKGHADVAKYLIQEQRANIECTNVEGFTPASVARCNGHEELLQLLTTHGARLRAPSDGSEIIWDMFQMERHYEDGDFVIGEVGSIESDRFINRVHI